MSNTLKSSENPTLPVLSPPDAELLRARGETPRTTSSGAVWHAATFAAPVAVRGEKIGARIFHAAQESPRLSHPDFSKLNCSGRTARQISD